jgi:hypothetical protein
MNASVENWTPPQVNSQAGLTQIGGLSRVFHCNFYNAYLQMTVLMTQGMGNHDPEELLIHSVIPLIQFLKQQGYTDDDWLHEFSYCGFGILKPIDATTWETPRSHYSEALCFHGKPSKSCYFTSGYLAGWFNQSVVELECQMLKAAVDKFQVLEKPLTVESYLTREFTPQTQVPERFTFDGCQTFHTQVNEQQIITTLKQLPLFGHRQKTGLIEAFGAVLTNHFADYYNRISYETYFALRQIGLPEEESKEMFIQAGHICAFNTFGRIMSSPEWEKNVLPQLETQEDWFHGMIAVINMFGWGLYRIEKIDAKQEFIVRVYNSYEGIGYRRMYPLTTDKNISFLAMGATLGLVHLLWKIDIREKPTLTQEFYVKQFNNPENSYTVEQTHAIAAGDEYDRLVISK